MARDKMKCVFCKGHEDKIILFVSDKLKKCQEVLSIRVKYKLKYSDIVLPTQINNTDGYHRQCYSSFTALMTKYRGLLSEADCTSNSTPNNLSSSIPVDISETIAKNLTESSNSEIPCEVGSSSSNGQTTSGDSEQSLNSKIIPEDVASNSNNLPEDVVLNLDIQSTLDVATSSNCGLIINESNVCDDIFDINIEEIDTGRQVKNVCFYCNKDRKQNKSKQQNLHSSNDAKHYQKIIEWMDKLNNEELLQKINHLKSANQTIFYHHLCELNFLNEYNKSVSDVPHTSWHKNRNIHKEIFNYIVSTIEEEVIKKRHCVSLSSLCDMYNDELKYEQKLQPQADICLITNNYLEEKIRKYFQKTIKIISRQKKKIIINKNCSLLEDDLSQLEENDLIDKVALILRDAILKIDKSKLPSQIKTKDLIAGECVIPHKLDRFFKIFIGGKDIRRRDGINCNRLSSSMAADAIFCVSNGTVKPSKHITLGMTIKSLTSSKKIINILNRLGHCCNYTTLEELETEATISSVQRSQVCPPDIIRNPSLCTGVAFDNFDRYIDTLDGKETLHDTVGIIYQNIDNNSHRELNENDDNADSENVSPTRPPLKRKRSLKIEY
ncbi:hypothetical protein PV328_000944 [Microctonus aethiopoides]|uniref:Uncharacterized protein n=1 Tax=Microctonus aethiopoides TaxID=144406 RepID=A0AA39FVX8_9HYME|nr:hypothetical protein PV328_000944 [Microctonus aethiopoides]